MPLYEVEHHVPLRDNQRDTLAKQITNIHSRLFTTPSLFVNVRFLDKGASGDYTYVGGKRVCVLPLDPLSAIAHSVGVINFFEIIGRKSCHHSQFCISSLPVYTYSHNPSPIPPVFFGTSRPSSSRVIHVQKRNLNRIIAHVRGGGGRSTDDFNHLCDLVTEAWNRCVNDGNTQKRPTELHGIFVMGSIVAGTEAGFSLPPVCFILYFSISCEGQSVVDLLDGDVYTRENRSPFVSCTCSSGLRASRPRSRVNACSLTVLYVCPY